MTSSKPLIIAHAGGAALAPENTLAAVHLALTAGSDGIEVDIRATSDGVPILLHDATVDRTTDGAGSIADLTFEQVRKMGAGAKLFGGAFRGERTPTLAETLDKINGKALLVAEIKLPGGLAHKQPLAQKVRILHKK